jgi:ferritin-like protein
METKQTAVEWLAEKYNYITWLRNRDEISAVKADEWRAKYLEQAKEMEKEQIIEAIIQRIKDEEKKHSKSIEDWYRIAANKIYATFDIKINK